jgi:hypothetical protein
LYVIILKNVKNKGAERNAAALWDDRVERATKDEGEGKVVKREAHTGGRRSPANPSIPFIDGVDEMDWDLGGKGKAILEGMGQRPAITEKIGDEMEEGRKQQNGRDG